MYTDPVSHTVPVTLSNTRLALFVLVLSALLFVAFAFALRSRLGCLLLALVSAVWLVVDSFFEGAVILGLTASHGLVVADLVGIAGVLVAAALWWWHGRRSRP